MNIWIVIAGLSGFFAVLSGAVGEHVLHLAYGSQAYFIYETAVRYQVWHTLVIFLIGLFHRIFNNGKTLINVIASLFVIGILLFCGGIYLHLLTHRDGFTYVVPLGGLAFMLGWLLIVILGFMRVRRG